MRFPAVFVNHGGGPMPLMGRQPALVENMKEIVQKHLPQQLPKAIVILSAHWESDPIKITSAQRPSMYYDYGGFPPETYEYQYPAPGSSELAKKIQDLLGGQGLKSELDDKRGFDHGVFVPLMIMYPEADVPVVCVSLHKSLSAEINMKIGTALAPLRDEEILLLGSGYSFHNMNAFFNPSEKTVKASSDFNDWLKDTIMNGGDKMVAKLQNWASAPGGRISHPREEHLLPLLMVAAAGMDSSDNCTPQVIYETEASFAKDGGETNHKVTGYLFQ